MKRNPREYVESIILKPLSKGETPIRRQPRESVQQSGTTGKTYRGCNQAILQAIKYDKEFTGSHWFTFNSIKKNGGSVKKGEKATYVVFADMLKKDVKNGKGEMEEKKFFYQRLYATFNISQTTLSDSVIDSEPKEVIKAEELINNIDHQLIRGPKAFYAPKEDLICMPLESDFINRDEFYHTYLHELSHWTGSKDRLNRKGVVKAEGKFGDSQYSFEELIAESASSYAGQQVDIDMNVLENSRIYFLNWYQRIANDSKFNLVSALNKGWEASEYLLKGN